MKSFLRQIELEVSQGYDNRDGNVSEVSPDLYDEFLGYEAFTTPFDDPLALFNP